MNKTTRVRNTTYTLALLMAVALVLVTVGVIASFDVRSAPSPRFFGDALGGRVAELESDVKIRVQDRGAPDHPPGAPDAVPPKDGGAITEQDGFLPDGVTVFDDAYPGVSNLDPDLLQALREAATHAANDGVQFYVSSGWRSPAYQNQLLREAVSQYGSEAEAARWVATAETSEHVSGNAVDIGLVDATGWLSVHGVAYGLCQIYGNEPWHFELQPEAISHGCQPMYADPTFDPRLQH